MSLTSYKLSLKPTEHKFTGRYTPTVVYALSLGISVARATAQIRVCVVMGLN